MIKMNEEELYKLAISDVPTYSLLNEILAIRDNRFPNEEVDYCINVNGYISLDVLNKYVRNINELEQLQNNWNELKKLIDERIGDCRYFLANADVNYEKENMKKFMWLKEELQVLKSKAQELEQGKDE